MGQANIAVRDVPSPKERVNIINSDNDNYYKVWEIKRRDIPNRAQTINYTYIPRVILD